MALPTSSSVIHNPQRIPLFPGARVGLYQVAEPLGEGGMGAVYRARDTKLDRDVAIKVLPEAFARDPERVARSQREAKTLASFDHSNIGGIDGLEEASGITALVLELVEGPTLAELLAGRSEDRPPHSDGRGRPSGRPLPIDEALSDGTIQGVRVDDIAPDGKRFLMIKAGSGDAVPAPQKLVIVEHWFEELTRLVPKN